MQHTTSVFAMIVALLFVSTIIYQSSYAQTEVGVDVGVEVGVGVSGTEETDKNKQNKESKDDLSAESHSVSKIKVIISEGIASIKIESEGKTNSYVLKTQEESEIIASIESETGLSKEEIRTIWDFEIITNGKPDTKSKQNENSMANSSTKATMTSHLEAKERAIEVLTELKNRLSIIEDRFQKLIVKLESGTYFGNTLKGDDTTNNYRLSFDGSGVAKSNLQKHAKYSGELFLETLITTENQSKFKITGGHITIDGQSHEVVFGKARTSLGFSGEKDTMVVICQILNDKGVVTTLKLLLETQGEFEADFGLEPEFVSIVSQKSKISSKWSLDGAGQITLL